jgi:NADPH:quinone reductase-like Zn-dependent oxidoreductase
VRAMVVHALGEAPRLAEVPEPVPDEGQALVTVRAAPINPADVAIAAGRFYREVPPPPFVAGSELVGEVERSARFPAGTRVWALCATGGLAERAVVSDAALVPVPDGLEDGMAGAAGIAGLAGWMAVRRRGAMASGETVVVLGASGVVGQAAVQAAASGGARRVVAATRSEEGRRRALSLGATDGVDLTAPDLAEALANAVAPGADLVIDTLWGTAAPAAIAVLRRRGRLVQVGSSAGPTAELTGGPLRGGRIDIRGFSLFSEEPEDVAAAYAEAASAALSGELRLTVEALPLEDGPAAWERLVAGAGGAKLVLIP